jgi:hypothetical protein
MGGYFPPLPEWAVSLFKNRPKRADSGLRACNHRKLVEKLMVKKPNSMIFAPTGESMY